LDYWNSDDADGDATDGYIKLSAGEVKAVLALRVDFTPKLLAQLKL